MDSSSSATGAFKEWSTVLLADWIVDMALDEPDWNGNGMVQYQEWTQSGRRSPPAGVVCKMLRSPVIIM
jgi:hypothetical protein